MSNDTVKKLKEAWDIVGEIQKHVTLSKRGQNFVGLCPFHSEKTPSFYVSPQKKIFHCFGCGEHGDVITFMMKHENLSFKEVIIEKAKEFQIPHDFLTSNINTNELDKIRDFLNELQLKYLEWYKENAEIQQYAVRRHLSYSDTQQFGIGYGPKASIQISWVKNCDFQETSIKSGLFKEDLYPLLSDRLIFPIHNSRGILVGFSGRTTNPENKAKYINSHESSVFSKKKLLYGLHLAKKRAKEVDRLIIVEGYMDVIAMHQHGFQETVAVMGTALTEFHAKELSKFTKNIVLMFDSDGAGQAAVRKSIPSLQSEGLVIQVATLQDKDPGDFFIEKNSEDMAKLIASANHYMAHYIKKLLAMEDIENPTKKSEGVMQLSQILMNEKDPIVKDHYLKTIAQEFDVSQNIMSSYMKKGDVSVQKKAQVSLKMDSKYKKSEDMVLYFLIASLPFRKRYLSECIDIISCLQNNELKTLLETSELVDYDIIEQISHSEIKGFLLSLVIKFTEFKITYKIEEMEEYLHLLKQSKFNQRISEIKQLLGSNKGNKEKELLLELSELIKKIK